MKKIYLTPATSAQFIQHLGVLMTSGGDRATSNVGVFGGDNSGDVNAAF